MEVIEVVLLILLVVVCISMGALVLIQQGRGSDIGAAFGSGAANTLFGSTGATPFLVKFTAMLTIGFFAVTFALAYTAKEKSKQGLDYDFGDIPQAVEESTDESTIPLDEDFVPPEEDDTEPTQDGDELPTTDETDDSADILDQLLDEERSGDDLQPIPDKESDEGDSLPDL